MFAVNIQSMAVLQVNWYVTSWWYFQTVVKVQN